MRWDEKKGLEPRENARLILTRLCMRGHSFVEGAQVDSYIQTKYILEICVYFNL